VLAVEFEINLLAPAEGERLEAVGTVIKPGRTLTICKLEVFAIARRTLVAVGQPALIQVETRPAH
jgi:acyl-coenzyme A thioesterase PaaI-like protein